MEDSNRAIGLLDSGVGGLTVAREIFKLMPAEDIIYYGDSLHLPYGPKDLKLVKKYVEKIISYLLEVKKVKAVVIACNTATSAALTSVQKKFEVPIFGMIDSAAARSINLSKNKKIAVIGTEGTINSQAYQNSIKRIDKGVEVFGQACPKFVELVEKGNFNGDEVITIANQYLEPLIEAGIDSLILGCTHFPYLSPVLTELVGEKVKLINPAHEMAVKVKDSLKTRSLLNSKNIREGKREFIVSDSSRVSQRFLEHGKEFLQLKELNFNEENIFAN